jgi:hypothetical protein
VEPILETVAVKVRDVPTLRGEASDDVSVVVDVAAAKVTVVALELTGLYVASPAFVAVTVQVPALVLESEPLVTVQPVAVPFVKANVTAPVPEPPDVVSVSAAPNVPDVEVTVSAACAVRAAAGNNSTNSETTTSAATTALARFSECRDSIDALIS